MTRASATRCSCRTGSTAMTAWVAHPPARIRWGGAMTDLRSRLLALGLTALADNLDDVVALVTKKRWGFTQALEHIVDLEERDRARRGLERRTKRCKLERFKPVADFDWNWPTEID